MLDAFERAQQLYPHIRLQLCCDADIDFNTDNHDLKRQTLRRIASNRSITFGRIDRSRLIEEVLPSTDVFLIPTYNEAFGFAILEAMAFGIPVIATDHFAIPEIITADETGFLIDTSAFDTERLFRGYRVDVLPDDFREHVSNELFKLMCPLIESPSLRETVGLAAAELTKKRFSFESRNATMRGIYDEALI